MRQSIRIAQVKVLPEKGDLEANHELLMSVLGEIAGESPDVVVTPECFLDGYVSTEESVTRDSLEEYAIDPESSPFAEGVSAWAAANSSWVIFGCSRLAAYGACNTALIYDRAGELAGAYDKTHLQCHDEKYLPGDDLPVFGSDFGPFGVMICADRRWPETVRTLALAGARIIFNPTFGMHDERNLCMMRTRSFESEVFIAFTHPRQALVTGPKGQVIGNQAGDNITYAVCEVDLAEADAVRAAPMAHLRDRRSDIYAL